MTALVFGGTGLIGRSIVTELRIECCDGRVVGLGSVCDIVNPNDVLDALHDHEPTVVVNAAWPDERGHIQGFHTIMREAIDFWRLHNIGGCLINIASIYATLPPRFEIYPEGMDKDPAYVAAKAAIVQLTQYYARKVRGSGIRVNCVSPGGVYRSEPIEFVDAYSRQTNHGRMLPAEAVAQACRFLVECKWVTGVNLTVDDGFSL